MPDPIAFRVMNEIGIIDQLGSTLFERSMPFGLTLPQFVVLNHFVRVGGDRSPVELASAIQVTKATMTSTLQRLQRKGFVTSVPDATAGRLKRMSEVVWPGTADYVFGSNPPYALTFDPRMACLYYWLSSIHVLPAT